MEEEASVEFLWKSEPQPESIVSLTLSRAITSLLSARSNKLQDSISRLSSHSPSPSTASLHDSLLFFHSYVTDAANHNRSFDQLLVPIIHSSLKCKNSKHGGQAIILLNWLFQDELIFVPVAEALASIITRRNDRYLLFGWCLLLRSIVDYDSSVHQSMLSGIRERYSDLLKILSTCLHDLAGIVSNESTLQDGFELPSRLGVSAADCFLALSGALTKADKLQDKKLKFTTKAKDQAITLVQCPTVDKKVKTDLKSLVISKFERDYTLWHHLDDLICLVQRLLSWSKKSRFLHAKGLEQVLKWLEEIKDHYGSFQPEADTDSNAFKNGDLLLSSCWKHYYLLLHLEDQKFSQHYKELLDQYLSGIQYYMDNHASGSADNKDSGLETTKFFLNCLCLLLGRLDSKRFESTMSETGMKISRILVPQLGCTDEDVIVGAVSIFKAIILKPNHSQEDALINSRQANIVIPFLLHLLDEQDGTSRAVVMLIAEYCSLSKDDMCLMEVLKRLASENISERRNAMDVIAEILHISLASKEPLPHSAWQETANTLLERLGDKDIWICEQASKLLPMIDPSLYLLDLVRLVYSPGENQSSASDAIIGVLKRHNQNIEIIFLLVDCLNNISQSLDLPAGDKESKVDTARVLKLVPEWSKSVQDWNSLIGPLIDKMFADPSNAAIVKFFSYISEDLKNVVDLVLHHVLLHVREQKEIDESFLLRWERRTYTSDEYEEMQRTLFEHLCPLLIIKMLPMKTFDDLNSPVMYGHLSQNKMHGSGSSSPELDYECISAFLLNRALREFEFEDVRKLSAELCGRIHPQVLLPVISSKLDLAVDSKNVLKIKACLFSICTSLVVRGWESLSHPLIHAIKRMIETVLLWPCLNAVSVSKVQHGCIDCLALMICVELQAEESITDSMPDRIWAIGKKAAGDSIVTYVMNQFFNDKKERTSNPEFVEENCESVAAVPLSFRLYMGNVLISTCQKISESYKKHFAGLLLPFLLHSLKFEIKSEIRAACIQVLFSAVYHLRSAVVPYAYDLLKTSLEALRKESEKERMAGAKLIASLMASEDVILENISVGLLEARSVLSTVSSSDPLPELRQLCSKLLLCISSP